MPVCVFLVGVGSLEGSVFFHLSVNGWGLWSRLSTWWPFFLVSWWGRRFALLDPWLELEALKFTFECCGHVLRFWLLSGDGLTLRVPPFGVRNGDVGGSMALAGLECLSFGLPVSTERSVLTLVISDLSLLTAVVL